MSTLNDPISQLLVLADWDRTYTFAHANADISSRVLQAEWSWGFTGAGQIVAPPAGGQLVLDNADNAFTVGRAGGTYAALLKPGVCVKIQHSWTGYTFILLRIANIRYAPGQYGQRVCIVTLEDWTNDLNNAVYDPPLATNVTTGAAITSAFRSGRVGFPYTSYWWVMGASQLGVDTRLLNPGAMLTADTGQTTLPYVGDNQDQGQGASLMSFINDTAAAEMGGRFLYARDRYRFIDRHTLAAMAQPANGFEVNADQFLSLGDYTSGAELLNKVDITVYPRRVGSAGTELWRSTSPYRLTPGETREVTARYRDPDYPDGTCAATTVIPPVASTDYTANAASDGSGADLTANLGVSTENRTNAAYLQLTNSGTTDLYVTLLKVRGTPLTARTPITLKSADAESVHSYGAYPAQLTVTGTGDTELAQRYADVMVRKFKDPIAGYRRVSMTFPYVREVLTPMYVNPKDNLYWTREESIVRINDPYLEDTASQRTMWISGVQHVVSRSTQPSWVATWTLEDFVQQTGWQLGHPELSKLGQSTYLVF